jgi:class 3 adenylate cyclase
MVQKPVILIADDDDDVRDMMVEYLSAAGFTLREAADVPAMLHLLEREAVDLLLLDRTMPGGDTLGLVPSIRRRHPALGIVMVTALGQDDDRVQGLNSGADDYVCKPFNWRELVARIQAVLRRRSRADGPGSAPPPTGPGRGRIKRRLAAVMFADVEGFTRLMRCDESGTLRTLRRYMHEVIIPQVAAHDGRIAKTLGDGFIAEFVTAQQATHCACALQRALERRNVRQPAARRVRFRIGLHLAPIMVTADGDIFGDGVNLAARLQGMAPAGGILVSDSVRAALVGEAAGALVDLGAHPVKNLAEPVRMFRLEASVKSAARTARARGRQHRQQKGKGLSVPCQNHSRCDRAAEAAACSPALEGSGCGDQNL